MAKKGPDVTLDLFDLEVYRAGRAVFGMGDDAECAYLIREGEVEIVNTISVPPRKLATLGAGEIFGEMALIDGQTRSAAAVALTDLTVTIIPRPGFEMLLYELDPGVRALMTCLVKRLREAAAKD